MRFSGFVGMSYKLSSLKAECQNSLNLFLEIDEARTAREGETGRLVATPGLRLLATVGDGPIRGAYVTSNGRLAIVSGNKLYVVSPEWTAKESGTLVSNTGYVDMIDNGTQIFIVDGSAGYILTMTTGVLTQIISDTFIPGPRCGFLDGYFTNENPGTGQFQISALYDGLTWGGLDFGTAEGSPDNVISHLVFNRQLWLAGTKTMEVFWNSGNADFPLTRIDGSFIEYGCGAPFSFQKFAGSCAWVTDNGVVMMAQGFTPTRISTHAVEYAIRQMGDFSTAYAWTYQQDGHYFYCLNLGDNQTTWVYDIATGAWHERSRLEDGQDMRHKAAVYAHAYNTHVVGDGVTGALYALDLNVYTDNGEPIARERTTPHLTKSMNRLFISKFQLDCQVGVGLDGVGQGTDPKIMLKVSYDGGYTFKTERNLSLGKIGNTYARVIARRLGQGRDLIFRVRYTDPTPFTILGAEIDVEAGAN